MQSTCVWVGSRVPNLQTEFNYLDSFKSYGILSDFVVPMVPTLSLWSPHRPCHYTVIPVSSLLSPHHPHSPQKVPMWSPWLWSLCSPPHVVSVVLVVPMSSTHHPRHPHIIPTSSRRFPHYPQPPDTHSTHPPPPWGVGGLESVKMQ